MFCNINNPQQDRKVDLWLLDHASVSLCLYGWKIFPESLVTSRDCCSWRERGENQLDKFGHCMTLRLSPRNLQWGTGLELVSFIKCFRHKTLQLSLWIHRCRPPYQTLLGTNSSLYKACELSQYFHAVVEDGDCDIAIGCTAASPTRILRPQDLRFFTTPVTKGIKFRR